MPSACPVHEQPEDPRLLFFQGELDLQAHQVGFIVTGIFCVVACTINGWLIWKHLAFYTHKRQQRQIVRILFMVPIYALVSWMSYFWWQEALYFQLVRDCYEAFVLTSFFYLLLYYVGDNTAEQKVVFKRIKLEKWMFPLGQLKYRPDSWHFVMICKWMILQYVVLRPLCTLAACISNSLGYYCADSWSSLYVHVWTTVIITISVSIALYIVLQFTVVLSEEIAPYKPMLKFLVVKGLVFIIFWQYVLLSVLMYFNVIKETKYWSAEEVATGFEALLITFEMVFFALAHIKAFSYLPYRAPGSDPGTREALQTNRWRAFLNVIDYRDVGREMNEGTVYMAHKMLKKEEADRRDDLAAAFGKVRLEVPEHALLDEKKRDQDKRKNEAGQSSKRGEMTELEQELQRVKLAGEEEGQKRLSFASDRKALLWDSPRLSTDSDRNRMMSWDSNKQTFEHIRYPSVPYDSYIDPYEPSAKPSYKQKSSSVNGLYTSLSMEEDKAESAIPQVPSASDDRQPQSRKEGVAPGKRRPKKTESSWWSSLRHKKKAITTPDVQDAQIRGTDLWLGSVPSVGPSPVKEKQKTQPADRQPRATMQGQRYPSSRPLPKQIKMPSPLSPSRYPSLPSNSYTSNLQSAIPAFSPAIRQTSGASSSRLSLDGRYPLLLTDLSRQHTAPEMKQIRSASLTYPSLNFASSSQSIRVVTSNPRTAQRACSADLEPPPTEFSARRQGRPQVTKRLSEPMAGNVKSQFLFEEC